MAMQIIINKSFVGSKPCSQYQCFIKLVPHIWSLHDELKPQHCPVNNKLVTNSQLQLCKLAALHNCNILVQLIVELETVGYC